MTAYSIIRINKLKSWGAVAGAVAHNARTRETLNADPSAPCRFLIGSPTDDPVAVCKARLGDQRIRKNAVYGVDSFLGASPEYFRPDAPGQYGLAYADRLNAWVETVAWLQDRYGNRVINAVLHLDEATPHIQYLLLPLDDKGKLNYKSLFGGSKYVLSQLQSDYANAVAHLGLTRGREGSKAKHTEVAEYYSRTQAVEHTAIPELPSADDIQPPEPPSTMARMKSENLITYAKEAAVKAIKVQMAKLAPVLEALTKQNDLLTTENARLRQEREQLKDANSQLSLEIADFKAVANQMRELALDQVLVKMYGATEEPNSKPKNKSRTFTLPDGLTVEYSDNQWQSPNSGRKGKGAINLVMYLSGYGQDQYQQAVHDMTEIFESKDITGSFANYMMETAPRQTNAIARQKFQMPAPCKSTWQDVRDHLVHKLNLPPAFIDKAHEDGLIFSDQRFNCVFTRDNASGIFKLGTGTKPFSQSLGKEGAPFVMHGTDNKLYIVDSPMEALSLKLMHPDSTILATNGFMHDDKLKPYIDQKEVFITQGQDGISKEISKFLCNHIPNSKLIQPKMGKSWNECRLLQIEEEAKERRQQAQAAAQARVQALTATPTINRSSGMGMGR